MRGIVELTAGTSKAPRFSLNAKTIMGITEPVSGTGTLVSVACGSCEKDIMVKEDYDTVLRLWKVALSKHPRPSGLE